MQQGLLGINGMQCFGKLAGGGAHRSVGIAGTRMSRRASAAAVARRKACAGFRAREQWRAGPVGSSPTLLVVATGPAAVGSLRSAVLVSTLSHAIGSAFVGHALHNPSLQRIAFGAR